MAKKVVVPIKKIKSYEDGSADFTGGVVRDAETKKLRAAPTYLTGPKKKRFV